MPHGILSDTARVVACCAYIVMTVVPLVYQYTVRTSTQCMMQTPQARQKTGCRDKLRSLSSTIQLHRRHMPQGFLPDTAGVVACRDLSTP